MQCRSPESGRSPGGGHGNPLQYSCLKNPMDRGIWQGNSPWGQKQSDTAERLTQHTCMYPLSSFPSGETQKGTAQYHIHGTERYCQEAEHFHWQEGLSCYASVPRPTSSCALPWSWGAANLLPVSMILLFCCCLIANSCPTLCNPMDC